MEIKALYLLPLFLCSSFFSIVHAQVHKIYLQPKTIAREKQSKYIDSISFIPLEVKKDIELGAYYNIEVTKKYLLLVDYMNKRLIVYSKKGQFVKNINYNKLGGNFYPSYQERSNQIIFFGGNKNYALTPKDQIQIKLDWANPRNKKYFKKYTVDLDDSTLSLKKGVPDEKDIVRVFHYYDDYYMQGEILVSPLYKDSLDYELKMYKDNKLVKAFYPYNHINEPRFLYAHESTTFSKTDNPYTHIITRPYCDTVYKMVKDSLFPAYQLVLPLENSLPASYISKPFKNKTERENFDRNNGWLLHQVYSFYETPKFIVFSVSYSSNYDSYIYEKATDITYKTKNIRADSSQFNLGLLADFSIQRRGDQFYKPLRASDLLPFFEKNKNVPIPKELETFVKSKPPGTTPVIVAFKLKN